MSREIRVEDNNRYQVYSFPFREINSLEQRRSFCLPWGTSQGVILELRLLRPKAKETLCLCILQM